MYTYVNFNIWTAEIAEMQISPQRDNVILHRLGDYSNARGNAWFTLYFYGDYREKELELKRLCYDRLIEILTKNRSELG